MRNTKLRELLRSVPFRPFAIHLSEGSRFVVRHPEFVALGEHYLVVTEPVASPGVSEHATICDPLHVTRVAYLRTTA